MENRDSKTREEEREHLKSVHQPEDFEHPEPDEEQPEAREGSHGLHRILPIVIILLLVLVAAMLFFSGGAG